VKAIWMAAARGGLELQALDRPPSLPGAHHSDEEEEEEEEDDDDASFAAEGTPLLASHSSIVAARRQAGAPRGCPPCVRRCYRLCSRLSGLCPSCLLTRHAALTLVYVLTGAAQPTLTDAVRYAGGVGATNTTLPLLLPMLANTAGMAGVGLMLLCPASDATTSNDSAPAEVELMAGVRAPRTLLERCASRQMALLVVVDMASSALILSGLLLVGSGVYVVMYSSTTLWTAAIAVCSGTSTLSRRQWLGALLPGQA
jgi:hypothetical protein